MYRESVLKSTNVSRINKIFSYLLLVFAFFIVGMINENRLVNAACGGGVCSLETVEGKNDGSYATIFYTQSIYYIHKSGTSFYYNRNQLSGITIKRVGTDSGGTGICNVVVTMRRYNSSGTQTGTNEYKNDSDINITVGNAYSFDFSIKFNHGLACVSNTVKTTSRYYVYADGQAPTIVPSYSSNWTSNKTVTATATEFEVTPIIWTVGC